VTSAEARFRLDSAAIIEVIMNELWWNGGRSSDDSFVGDFKVSSELLPPFHHNSFMITSMIAAESSRKRASADITGAYLLVEMTSEVYMTLKKVLVDIIVTLDPSYI
jgi:hypothetical protein